MEKRYRDEKGNLTISLEQLRKETEKEAAKYYIIGGIYHNAADGREYVYISNDGILSHLQSFDSFNLFISMESMGTFLPDVASEGMELTFIE